MADPGRRRRIMSSGFSANFADVVPTEKVVELSPDEVSGFVAAVAAEYPEEGVCDLASALGLVAREFACGEDDQHGETVRAAWESLAARFGEVTGLGLEMGFHDPEDGGPYDEVEGAFLCVDAMYEVSPAGRPFVGIVERRMWVSFG